MTGDQETETKVRAGIADAKERIRKGETRPGLTADDLLALAREQKEMDLRSTPHGTLYGYNGFGCRCDACRSAKREYSRHYYERKREQIKARVRKWARDNPEQNAATVRRYRERHPDRVELSAAQSAARRRALTRLGARHPEELAKLVAEELGS